MCIESEEREESEEVLEMRSEKYYERLCKVIKYYVGCEEREEREESVCEGEVCINEIIKVEVLRRLCEVICEGVIYEGVLRCKVKGEYNIKSEKDYREYIFGGEGLRLNGYERYL